jgi:hypothetical protein
VQAYCKLASSYRSASEFRKAELTLLRAIEVGPLQHEAWVQLGRLYVDLGEWRAAADVFEHACALVPGDPAGWIGLGLMRIATGDMHGAIDACATLLEKFADRSESHLIEGHIRRIQGEAEAAAESYRRALRLDARQTEALFNLVDLFPPAPADPLTGIVERLCQDSSLSQGQAANVRFAMARILDNADRTDEAFNQYQKANASASAAQLRLGKKYVPKVIEDEAAEWMTMFAPAAFGGGLEPLDLDIRLIFIVGLPRSGTTLAERILSSHSRAATGGEMPFMRECLHKLQTGRESAGKRGRIRLDDGVERAILRRARDDYVDRLFERDLDADYVIDKLPANFAALGLIRILFPDAIMVHCVRDPIATCWSLYCANFPIHLPYYNSLEHLAHYHHVYAKLMRYWMEVFGPHIFELSYEKLVLDPEPQIRDLVRHCGLPWEDACLSFYENKLPIYTASMQQARRPIYRDSVGRWRKFEKYLTPLIEALSDRPTGSP